MQPTETTVTASEVTPSDTLRAAALYLAGHGWIQGSYYDQTASWFTPAACVVGAIGMVCYGGPVETPAEHSDEPGWAEFDDAVTHLDAFVQARYDADSAYGFNDTPGRTAAEVVAALVVAATEWDELHGGGAA